MKIIQLIFVGMSLIKSLQILKSNIKIEFNESRKNKLMDLAS